MCWLSAQWRACARAAGHPWRCVPGHQVCCAGPAGAERPTTALRVPAHLHRHPSTTIHHGLLSAHCQVRMIREGTAAWTLMDSTRGQCPLEAPGFSLSSGTSGGLLQWDLSAVSNWKLPSLTLKQRFELQTCWSRFLSCELLAWARSPCLLCKSGQCIPVQKKC